MIHFIIVFFSVAVIFIFFKRICIWTWGATTMPASHWAFHSMYLQVHLAVPQSVVQLHLMIFKSSAGAGGISVSTGCNPVSLRTHPHSFASKSHRGSFHWFTCKNTRQLGNLAAAEVGGNDLGSTCVTILFVSKAIQGIWFLSIVHHHKCSFASFINLGLSGIWIVKNCCCLLKGFIVLKFF